jgi:DNA-binding FrmR family transcriptional regulator
MASTRKGQPVLHDAASKRAMDSRLARVEGQVRGVRRMIAEDRACEDIALQLAAARKALDRAFYEMISCLIRNRPPNGATARGARAGKVAELLARFG